MRMACRCLGGSDTIWMRAEYRHRMISHLSTIIRGSQRAVLKQVRIFAMKIILKNRGKYREPLSKRQLAIIRENRCRN